MSKNKEVVRAYADAFSRGDFAAVAQMCTEDVFIQGVLGKGGLAVALPIWQDLHRAFGTQLIIEELVEEGDTVVARFTERGTSRAEFRGLPATGNSYQIGAMEWFHFRDGKIAARWAARDSASITRQIQGN